MTVFLAASLQKWNGEERAPPEAESGAKPGERTWPEEEEA